MQEYAAIILFFLFSLYLLYPENNNHRNTTNNINNINTIQNTYLDDYLKTVNPNMYNIKVGIHNVSKIKYENFYFIYLLSLKKITKNEKSLLKNIIERADKLIKLVGLKCLQNIPWKFWISHNNLELSMPFTIDNHIIIPKSRLSTISVDTLIHEKIHILQRKNQEKFNNYYKKLYPFLFNKIDNKIIPYELDKKHMTNPDGNNTYWIYRIHNKLWLPLLIYDKQNNSCIELAYPILFENNNVIVDINNPNKLRNLFPNMPNDISLYHPNEIFACQLASSIVNKRPIDTDLLNMLNSLC